MVVLSSLQFGDELLVMHNKNRMTLRGMAIEADAALVWRIVDGRISEVWGIPSAHSANLQPVSAAGAG